MIYAVLDDDGTVINRIELAPERLAAYAASLKTVRTLMADPDNRSQIGGQWDGKQFLPRPKTETEKTPEG